MVTRLIFVIDTSLHLSFSLRFYAFLYRPRSKNSAYEAMQMMKVALKSGTRVFGKHCFRDVYLTPSDAKVGIYLIM